jgi:phosphoglucosamine mutase
MSQNASIKHALPVLRQDDFAQWYQAVIAEAEAQLAGKGRLVIRPSGTEPVIRVMAEGDDAAEVEQVVDTICDAVRKAA